MEKQNIMNVLSSMNTMSQNMNNMLYQGAQISSPMWPQMPNQGENQVMPIYHNEMMVTNNSSKDVGLKKSPWTLDEEQVF